jgi:hypothetical protein
MKQKRLIAFLTIFVLLGAMIQVPGAVYAADQPKVTLKQAIEIVKSNLNLNTEGLVFNSSYVANQGGLNLWSLNWSDSKNNSENISVSVDANQGDIVSISWWTPSEQPTSKLPKYSRADAQKEAEKWAATLQGERFKSTKLEEDINKYYSKYSDVYSFEFVRVQNGINVTPNNITVQIDKNTLKLKYFNMMWDKNQLADKSKAFNLDKAKEIFKTKLGLELTYNLIYGDANTAPKAVLAYTLKNGNYPIDAVTGELLNSNIMYPYRINAEKKDESVATGAVVITREEQLELDKTSRYISKEDAEKIARQFVAIDNNMKLQSANLYSGHNDTNASWSLQWNYASKDNNTYKYLNIQVDAVTKELTGLYTSTNNSKDKTVISKEDAKKVAEAFLSKVQPEKFKKTTFKEVSTSVYKLMPSNLDTYSFNYVRTENGVPCPANSMDITIDKHTGQIVSFSSSWNNINFPAPSNTISPDKAYDTLFSKLKFDMNYTYHYPNSNDYDSRELKLAYILENNNIIIDAKNGQMLNDDGTPAKTAETFQYTDIKGNKAEAAINTLVDMGILIPESTTYAPDTKMLQKDFVKLLMNSLQPEVYVMPAAKTENPYDNFYTEAIRKKILTASEKNPDAAVTRQDAAKMILRAMNYGVIAEKSGMFATNFKDASKLTAAYKGYAVMAAEFGIIPTADGSFNPDTVITKGDAAQFIVNYMKCNTSL